MPVRPTTDFAKESLFNILNNHLDFENVKLLELLQEQVYGYEFASRGCTSITSVDLNFQCIQFIKKTNQQLAFNNKVIRSDAFRYIKSTKEKYNLIFADPPYNSDNIQEIPTIIFSQNLLKTMAF